MVSERAMLDRILRGVERNDIFLRLYCTCPGATLPDFPGTDTEKDSREGPAERKSLKKLVVGEGFEPSTFGS